jgi:hypothetical protein
VQEHDQRLAAPTRPRDVQPDRPDVDVLQANARFGERHRQRMIHVLDAR